MRRLAQVLNFRHMIIIHEPPLPKRFKRRFVNKSVAEPSLEEILVDVCNCFEQDISGVVSTSKKEELINCRRIFYYVASVLTSEKCIKISDFLSNQDHATFIHHETKALEWFKIQEPEFMYNWNKYVSFSNLWRTYYHLQKSA